MSSQRFADIQSMEDDRLDPQLEVEERKETYENTTYN